MKSDFTALTYEGDPSRGRLFIVDQTQLPEREVQLEVCDLETACEAVASLRVRGAPLLGVFSLYSFLIGLREDASDDLPDAVRKVSERIASVRPTAVNVRNELSALIDYLIRNRAVSRKKALSLSHEFAQMRLKADEDACEAIARNGQQFVRDGGTYITHCNTGSLATCGIGTALGILKYAHRSGKKIEVLVPETRPLLQGSRLTAFELAREGIPYRVLCEGALPSAYRRFRIDGCFVGADRIAANGDTANKVGTSLHALLCREYGVPFFVAAPMSSFDPSAETGASIPIEQRSPQELHRIGDTLVAPADSPTFNPAFDVTDNSLITAIITDEGVLSPSGEKIEPVT